MFYNLNKELCFYLCRNDLEVPSSGFLGEGARAQGGQGPPPMLAERFQSVITQLFQQVQFPYCEFLLPCLSGVL